MDDTLGGKNPYEILGLEKGPASSDQDIKKAYKRLALIKHPDKAKTPNAAAEFHELQQAYAVLTNKDARGALDDLLKVQAAREEKYAAQSSKRQKLREELNRREKQHATERSEEERARARLKEELAQLRQQSLAEQRARQRQQQQQAEAARKAAEAAAVDAQSAAAAAPPPDETTELLMRTLKVSWDPVVGTYTTERLRTLFSKSWQVEDVISKETKKKKHKAAALVVLGSIEESREAADSVVGDPGNPLLVVPYFKVAPSSIPAAAGAGGGAAVRNASNGAAGVGGTAMFPSQPEPGKPLFPASGLAPTRAATSPGKPLFPGATSTGTAASFRPPSSSSDPRAAFGSFSSAAAAFSSFPTFPSATGGSGAAGASNGAAAAAVASSFEGSVLAKMKQRAAERQRLIDELKEEEHGE